jgi:polyadenylate-binding protein
MKMKRMQAQMMQYGMLYPQIPTRAAFRGRASRAMPPTAVLPKPPEVKLPFDLNTFSSASVDVQKRMLGECLYPMVLDKSNKKIAGKITGMLLEIDPNALLKMVQSPGEVTTKVQEAIEVLRKAWKDNTELLTMLSDV